MNKILTDHLEAMQEVFVKTRKEKNLFSLAKVAAKAGVSENTIRNFESGKNKNLAILFEYASAIIEAEPDLKDFVETEMRKISDYI